MGFVNTSLLLGGLLTAIPVVLHLVLRQQPKRIVFPALRFLKERRESNRRELQLRHWLLLFLRCAVIAVGAIALARPSVASAAVGNWLIVGLLLGLAGLAALLAIMARIRSHGKWLVGAFAIVAAGSFLASGALAIGTLIGGKSVIAGDQQAPIAAAIVIDTSPRMMYRYQNQSRLELAQEMALGLLQQFPEGSKVSVLESRPGPAFFAVDFAAAKSMLERLRFTGIPDSLPSVLGRAIDLIASAENSRREVFVFTDLTQAAWEEEATKGLKRQLEEHPDVSLYVIDIGAESPRNYSTGELELSAQTLVQSGELIVEADISSLGITGEVTAELLVEEPDPTRPVLVDGRPLFPVSQVRDRRTVSFSGNGTQRVRFVLRGWEPGTQQGSLRIVTEDGFAQDNIRFFAVEVRDAWPVLVVAPPKVNTSLLVETLAPFGQRETGAARFDCEVIEQGDLANRNLAGLPVVCLLNPLPLPPTQWEQIGHYVENGGNLLVMLGHNAQQSTVSFNEPAAQRILGAKLARPWRSGGRDLFLSPQRFDHPALAIFREQASSVPWQELPIFYHWALEGLAGDTSTVAHFSNGLAAVVERPLGKGRVLVTTTPLAEESRPPGRPPWNELLTGENAWPGFVLVNEILRYLVSAGDSRLNYLTGETAMLVNDPELDPERYQLFPPSEDPQEVVARDGQLLIGLTEQPGAYRLKGQRGGPVVRGFAVNLPGDAGQLERLPREKLNSFLGERRFRFARNRDEIVLEVGEARAGREFYPFLIILVVVVLGMEQVLANRFYRKPSEPGQRK